MSFSTRLSVRFGDTDPAGFVYYPVIFHYLHVAMEEFFALACGTTYAQLIEHERIGFPVVKSDAEFSAPLLYGDEVEIEVHVSRTGDSSATFEYSVRRANDTRVAARVTQVHVAMNLDSRRAVSIPSNLRDAFLRSAS